MKVVEVPLFPPTLTLLSLFQNSSVSLMRPDGTLGVGRGGWGGGGGGGGGGDPGARSGFIDEVSPHCLPRDGQFILIMPLTLHLAAESL